MGSLTSIIISGLAKAILPQSVSPTKFIEEVYSSIRHISITLIFIGILLSSLLPIFCFGIIYYFSEHGYSIYQLLTIVISVIGALLVILIAFLINSINRIKEVSFISPARENKEPKDYNIISSFIRGFRSS